MRDKTTHLTPTECRLLVCLVHNTGRIVSHHQLLEAMSGESRNVENLRQYISRLRNKIETDPALPRVIITRHKSGYSFAGKEEARWFPELERL